jgi:hypothetical protein
MTGMTAKANLRRLAIGGILSTLAFAGVSLPCNEAAAAGDAKGMGEKYQLFITADRLVPLFAFTRGSISRQDGGLELTNSRSGSGLGLFFGRNVGYSEGAGNGNLLSDQTPPYVNVHLLPRIAFDFTIINRLTLGAAIAFGFGLGGSDDDESAQNGARVTRSTDAPTATAIGLAPRVGYIIPLAEHFAFWPRAGFAFYSVSFRADTVINNQPATVSATDTFFSLDLDPQFAIIPTQNFFFHVGPLVNIPLTAGRSLDITQGASTQSRSNDMALFHFGIVAGIGGWIGF